MVHPTRNLYRNDLLPPDTAIIGYARSKLSMEDLQKRWEPYMKVGVVIWHNVLSHRLTASFVNLIDRKQRLL